MTSEDPGNSKMTEGVIVAGPLPWGVALFEALLIGALPVVLLYGGIVAGHKALTTRSDPFEPAVAAILSLAIGLSGSILAGMWPTIMRRKRIQLDRNSETLILEHCYRPKQGISPTPLRRHSVEVSEIVAISRDVLFKGFGTRMTLQLPDGIVRFPLDAVNAETIYRELDNSALRQAARLIAGKSLVRWSFITIAIVGVAAALFWAYLELLFASI